MNPVPDNAILVNLKQCKSCRTIGPDEDFKGRLCRGCLKAYQAERYQHNRDVLLERSKARYVPTGKPRGRPSDRAREYFYEEEQRELLPGEEERQFTEAIRDANRWIIEHPDEPLPDHIRLKF